MEPAQRAIYEAIRLAMHAKVQAAIAAERAGAVRDHHSRCAAEDASGLLRSAAAEIEDRGKSEGRLREAGSADGNAARSCRRGAARAVVLAVHRDAGVDRGSGCRTRAIEYVMLTGDTKDRSDAGEEIPGRQGAGVPDQPEGRRRRAEPDRRRHGHPLRSLVEPGGRGPGDRSRAPHRPGPRTCSCTASSRSAPSRKRWRR